jgi:hypothetical protein
MISSEVQRTLVKSPPELWAELSDPSSLARHLGELGEIRITRAEPEKLVEWEAEAASGTVAIKASGWGTKVTLTVNRAFEPPQPAPATEPQAPATEEPESPITDVEPAATAAARFGHDHPEALLGSDLDRAAEPDLEPEPEETPVEEAPVEEGVAAAPPEALVEAEPGLDPEPEPEPVAEVQAEPVAEAEPAPRVGFFARLFGRRRRQATALPEPELLDEPPADDAPTPAAESRGPDAEAPDAAAQQPPPVAEEPPAQAQGDAGAAPIEPQTEMADEQDPPGAPAIDLAAELKAAEEAAEAEVTAILTGVLDRLGAAHHRPFSRS